jgi:ferrous iron transport protein A
MERTNLTKIRSGERGIVAEINGGHGIRKRLDAMGIRPGSEISKVSSQLMRGPITVALGNAQVAIGFGMAKKIIVDVKK